ncbi:WXG100 family type VII secretion target [Amycolatopsis sulphurea]|uniref:ESAT-6-like protein n=1 Tax=Amycolatopsis sulphurea TaxID=76022 RepID=A0A2A9FAZ0_9PSEU|nr:WXG100 family type VII secretion target [Amycolatopsis sulphurea]PFG47599.1 WXG100 family type VII secretion target [Amycolatopsis sulphurea]
MPDGRIVVDPATIHRASEDCTATTNQLANLFENLKKDLDPLVKDWTGEAKDQYMIAQGQWDSKFEDLKQLLAQIAAVLPQIADGYQATDRNVQNLF